MEESGAAFLSEKHCRCESPAIKARGELPMRARASGAAAPQHGGQVRSSEMYSASTAGICLSVGDKLIEVVLSQREKLQTSLQYFFPFVSKQTNYPLESSSPVHKSLLRRRLFCATILFFPPAPQRAARAALAGHPWCRCARVRQKV